MVGVVAELAGTIGRQAAELARLRVLPERIQRGQVVTVRALERPLAVLITRRGFGYQEIRFNAPIRAKGVARETGESETTYRGPSAA